VGLDDPWVWLILLVLFVVFFGAKRMPDGARALGRSMRIFKSEIRGLHDDDDQAEAAQQQHAEQVPAPLPAAPVTPQATPAPPPAAPVEQTANAPVPPTQVVSSPGQPPSST